MARAIGAVAPGAAMQWVTNRAALSAYIGAGTSGHNANWKPTKKSADAILRTDAANLVARARSLDRNNVLVSGALRKIVENVVHTGIRPQLVSISTGAALDDIEQVFADWAAKNKFYLQQALALRHWWLDGEVFSNLWVDGRRLRDGLCPLRVELLEQDLIDSAKDGADGQNIIRRGVELDQYGDPVAYWVLSSHPGDYIYGARMDSTRVDAERIIHLWMPERASQTRGISRLAPIIEEIRDLSEYQTSERIAARLESAFGIFIKTNIPEFGQQFGPSAGAEGGTSGVGDYLESGRIQTLPPGTEIQVAESKRPGSPYAEYVKASNKASSVGFGLRYGNYSHDYTESSFSSERSAALDERRCWIGQQQFLINNWCKPIMRRWLELAFATGLITVNPTDISDTWQGPSWPWVDPAKDATANEKKLAMCVTTRRAICADMGVDFDDIVAQLEREQKALAKVFPNTQGAQNAPEK